MEIPVQARMEDRASPMRSRVRKLPLQIARRQVYEPDKKQGQRIMPNELKAPQYPISDRIKAPEHEIEEWQARVGLLADIALIAAALNEYQ
jgi:hypothetical protein